MTDVSEISKYKAQVYDVALNAFFILTPFSVSTRTAARGLHRLRSGGNALSSDPQGDGALTQKPLKPAKQSRERRSADIATEPTERAG